MERLPPAPIPVLERFDHFTTRQLAGIARAKDRHTLVQSDLGVGKTREAARTATRFVAGSFNPPGEQPAVPLKVLFCVNDHKLAREVAATLNEEAPGIAVVWLGLRQPRYADRPAGETMCRRTEDAEMWIEAGGKMATMCARCPFGGMGEDEECCGYSLQNPRDVPIVIVAGPSTLKRRVRLRRRSVTFPPFDVVIVDEPKPTDWVEGIDEPIIVGLADVAGVVRPPDIQRTAAKKWGLQEWVLFDRLMAQAATVVGTASTLGHGEERQLTRAEAEAFNPGALRTLLQRLRMKPAAASSAGTGKDLEAALAADCTWNRRVRRLIAFCDAAIEARKVRGGTITPNIIAGNHAAWGTGLKLRLRRELTPSVRQAPTLLLDATGDAELLTVWWPRLQVAADIRVKMPDPVHVVQVGDTLAAYNGWAPLAEPPARKASTAVRKGHERSTANMMRLVRLADVIASQLTLGLVVPKRMEAALDAAWLRRGCRPRKVVTGHHGAIRGQNRFADVRVFINLSRMTPSVRDVEDLTETLTGRVAARIDVDATGSATYSHRDGSRQRHHIMRRGGVVAAEHAEWHPDPDVERVRRQLTDAEADQADGRSRAIRRDATTPLLHIRATALPSDRLEIDELVTMDDVVPFDAFDALAARGVVVPTGNNYKGGHQLLAAILSAEETLLGGRPAKMTADALRVALQRKSSLTRTNSIYSALYAVCSGERHFEAPSPLNAAPWRRKAPRVT